MVFGLSFGFGCGTRTSGMYEPCSTSKDCDLQQTDVCVLRNGGWCTQLCQTAADCPKNGDEKITCEPMGRLNICTDER
jgi:hypothetical protein